MFYERTREKNETDSFLKVATNVTVAQMSEKSDIKKFGDKAVVAIVNQYRQI